MSIIAYCRRKTKLRLLKGEYVHWIENNSRSSYIRQCVLSFPLWVTRKDLLFVWEECRELEKVHAKPYVIDHIIPISHPLVSGLSVPANLRAIPATCNGAKSNKWNPNQLDLFEE